jgi:hypothetical protein
MTMGLRAERDVHTSSWPGIAVRRTASLRSAYDQAIHVLLIDPKDVDARVKPAHDDGKRSSLNSPRHCEAHRAEAIQSALAAPAWIASLRSQ